MRTTVYTPVNISKLALLAMLLVMLFAATGCSLDAFLGPRTANAAKATQQLTCSNAIPSPAPIFTLVDRVTGAVKVTDIQRYAQPLRWADTLVLFATADSTQSPYWQGVAASGGRRLIITHPGQCTWLIDSLLLHNAALRLP